MKPMKRLLVLLACLPLTAFAHGPTPQKIDEAVDIHAPAAKVWETVRDFGSLDRWNPAVKKIELQGGNTAGSSRTLTFENGQSVTENLDAFDDAQREYRYRLAKENLEALPVSSYSATLRVTPIDEANSKVAWIGRAYRGDTSNEPPEKLSDEAAQTALRSLFRSGLDQLKKQLETGQ